MKDADNPVHSNCTLSDDFRNFLILNKEGIPSWNPILGAFLSESPENIPISTPNTSES